MKLALEKLGFGPCHHMEEVIARMPVQVPLWTAAVNGAPDWGAIYAGYASAVDLPTAGFFRELAEAYPEAKFVLTVRSPESWADSFGETIDRLLTAGDQLPPEMQEWLSMGRAVLARTGFPGGLDRAALISRFNAHTAAVEAAIPASRLLVFQVKDGWGPLCSFLRVPEPSEPFPRSNNREEFWELVGGGPAAPGSQPQPAAAV